MSDANRVKLSPMGDAGHGFVPSTCLHEGEDEYHFRFDVLSNDGYRKLSASEIRRLEELGNQAPDWSEVLVKDPFDVETVRNNRFYGLVRLGPFERKLITYHDFSIECGVTGSRIISSDIMENSAVHDCGYLSHYIVHPHCILYRIGELQTTNHSKFGCGVIKEGEDEDVRVSISVMNEAGGREILPFVGMNTADAWLWAKHRDRKMLMERLKAFTENTTTPRRGVYGQIKEECVIKDCLIIKDVDFGAACYVKGCNKLKNLTVDSSLEESTQLGEGIELVNGIVGKGSRIFYGCKAIRFVTGTHCNLKYGARLIHSFLGDNSTVSCCEVLNNLIFPFHEEHHNNSFLIATLVQGQSNMAAGATIGSNHNSRGNDGEIVAGRGFWPALSTTVKHDCRFASYTLITKGNYPSELDIPLPFSMLSDNSAKGRREVMPAYWWMYNMYALARNSWKFSVRDRRKERPVQIETDFLAPDTAYEIIRAITLMEEYCGRSCPGFTGNSNEAREAGRRLLSSSDEIDFEVMADGLERNRQVCILKPAKAYRAYHDMLLFYGMKTVAKYAKEHGTNFKDCINAHPNAMPGSFANLGGQLVEKGKLDRLIRDIETGVINSWDEVHEAYRRLAGEYDEDRLENAVAALRYLAHEEGRTIEELFPRWDERCKALNLWIKEQAVFTKQKDYENSFRWITYDNSEERKAVLGERITSVSFTLPTYEPVSWN